MPLTKLFAKANLKRAIKQTEDARSTNGQKADELFQNAYRTYSAVVSGDPNVADALYNWGSALFYQALTKAGTEAENLFRSSGEKFSACLVIDPGITSAAIDWGVALMEQARAADLEASHPLYDEAREKFMRAETLQAGSASYNLACIHALREEPEECLKHLRTAQEHGNLPEIDQMRNDSDLLNVRDTEWFQAFLDSLKAEPAKIETDTAEEIAEATDPAETAEPEEEAATVNKESQ